MSNIAVSIVVAVYNQEDRLNRCIDSLVYQTLENLEIILVDDYSTDNSWKIMEAWQMLFPDKITLRKSVAKGVAHAKNTGIQAAQGEYVLFVDSDDYVDYRICDRLYNFAVEHDFPEMVYSPIMCVSGKSMWQKATMEAHETIEDYLNVNHFYLHGKLFRADVFERFGLLPILRLGEDVCWLMPVISKLNTIVYFNMPSYFYELSPSSISLQTADPAITEDVIKGSELIMELINPIYKERAMLYAFRRICIHSDSRPLHADKLNKYILDHMQELDAIEDLETKEPVVYNRVVQLKFAQDFIPTNVYINGFQGETDTDAFMGAFYEDSQIFVLNEATCDFSKCPPIISEAWEAGNLDFVGKYFAVKACYEYGGIYIDKDIQIDMPFNMLRNAPSFFAFETDDSFSDKVFGGCVGNPCLKKILMTYEMPELYKDRFAPLRYRIKTILVGSGNIMMRSEKILKQEYGFCAYPAEMFVKAVPYIDTPVVCHYKTSVWNQEECITIPEHTLKAITDRQLRLKSKATELRKVKKDRKWLKDKVVRLEASQEGLLKDRDWLYNKASRLENKADRLEAKQADLLKDRDWLYNKASRLEKNVKSLDQELNAYRSSKLVRIAWRIQCFFGKVKHQLVKK